MAHSRGFICDNSAYSFWKTGEKPNWMDYVKWCKGFARHPRFRFAIVPDVIDGTEKENDDLLRMWDKNCWHPVKVEGCPVWHLHESIERLKRLCNGRWNHVALGSSGEWRTPGSDSWHERIREAFVAICDSDGYPTAKIHGLRMLSGDIVSRYPFASCDSTNAVQNGPREAQKNGVDSGWGKMTIARRIERVQSPSKRLTADRQLSFELVG